MTDVSLSTVTDGSGIFPVLKADPDYAQSPTKNGFPASYANFVSGFDNDGDYMLLPESNTGTVSYYNNAGTQITSGAWAGGLSIADIDADVDYWCGFMLDDTDSLLYVMGVDETTTPDTFYLASINAAGTVVNIGNDQASFSFIPTWGASGTGSSIYRTSDGSGNIYLKRGGGLGGSVQIAQFNISTGALVSDAAVTQPGGGIYKTAAGNTVGYFTLTNAADALGDSTSLVVSGDNGATVAVVPLNAGWPASTDGVIPLQWGGRIVFGGGFDKVYGIRACTVADFEARVDRLAGELGV